MVKSTFQIAKSESIKKKKKKSKDRNASPVEIVKLIFKKKKSGETNEDDPRIVSGSGRSSFRLVQRVGRGLRDRLRV